MGTAPHETQPVAQGRDVHGVSAAEELGSRSTVWQCVDLDRLVSRARTLQKRLASRAHAACTAFSGTSSLYQRPCGSGQIAETSRCMSSSTRIPAFAEWWISSTATPQCIQRVMDQRVMNRRTPDRRVMDLRLPSDGSAAPMHPASAPPWRPPCRATPLSMGRD